MQVKKPYVVAVAIQAIYTGLFVVSKAAFDSGINTYVFIFYRLAAATAVLLPLALINSNCWSRSTNTTTPAPTLSCRLLFKLFLYALLGKHRRRWDRRPSTPCPSLPSSLALLLRLETVNVRSRSGLGKLAGVALCLAGVLVIALFTGPSIRPLANNPVFAHKPHTVSNGAWIRGTFLLLLACTTWSLWIVLQFVYLSRCLKYPNKLMATAMQCLFGALQSFVVAVVVERDFSKWKLGLNIGLLAVLYSAFLGTGVLMYLQAWCAEMKGPVFVAMWSPLALVFTIICSSFFLGEAVHLGSILGGILLVGGLYSVLWGKNFASRSMRITCVVSSSCRRLVARATKDDGHQHQRPEQTDRPRSQALGGRNASE
ncbi:unnamed protein product [Alopecurus aequalis]